MHDLRCVLYEFRIIMKVQMNYYELCYIKCLHYIAFLIAETLRIKEQTSLYIAYTQENSTNVLNTSEFI